MTNTFGGVQNISREAADYIIDRDNKVARQWMEQKVFEVALTGELFEGIGVGLIDRAEAVFINLQNQRINGIDTELRYSTDSDLLGDGAERLSWRFLYSWLGENSIQTPGGVRDDRAGAISDGGYPQNKVATSLTYSYGAYSASLQARAGSTAARSTAPVSRAVRRYRPSRGQPAPSLQLPG